MQSNRRINKSGVVVLVLMLVLVSVLMLVVEQQGIIKLIRNDPSTKKALGLANTAIADNKEDINTLSNAVIEMAQEIQELKTLLGNRTDQPPTHAQPQQQQQPLANTATDRNNNATTTTTSNVDVAYTCTYWDDPRNNRTTVVVPYGAPTFVVIGVQKAGTTFLLELFRDHPDILVPNRELHFFEYWEHNVLKGASMRGLNTKDMNDADTSCYALDKYMTLFKRDKLLESPKKLYTMEKTPIYFADEKNVHRMKRTVPWTKLLVILRNPVDRLYSHYKMTIRNSAKARNKTLEPMILKDIQKMRDKRMTTAPLPEPVHAPVDNAGAGNHSLWYEILPSVPFDHVILDRTRWDFGNRVYKKQKSVLQSMVGRGLYAYQLEHWLQNYTIGTDLLVVNYGDLERDTKSVYERILDFVGIPFPTVDIDFDKKARTDDRRKHRPLSNETRRYLTEFYAPYNAQLESLLGSAWSPANLGWD